MENNLSYFQPQISDIHIGYEGEINWSRGYSETFVPFKITVQNEDFAYTGLLSEIVDAMDDGYAEVRTPYLTKEQIEKEGFKQQENSLICFVNKQLNIGVGYNFELHILKIATEDNKTLFNGYCPSINELRFLIKLVKSC